MPPSEQAGGSTACASALRDELVALLTGRGSSLPAFQGPSPVQLEADAGEPGCWGGAPCAARAMWLSQCRLTSPWWHLLNTACAPQPLPAVSTIADDSTMHVLVNTAALYRALDQTA